MSSNVASQLAAIDRLVDAISVERDRIADERSALLAASWLPFGEMQTRADSLVSMLDAIDRFVSTTIPNLEARARAGDADAAARALRAADNILRAVGSTSATSDLFADVSKLVEDIGKDAGKAVDTGLSWLPWVLGGLGVVVVGRAVGVL